MLPGTLADAPRVFGILATLAPQPPKSGVSIELLADFFCDIEAWFEVAQAYCATLNEYLFVDGLVSEKAEPLTSFLDNIVRSLTSPTSNQVLYDLTPILVAN